MSSKSRILELGENNYRKTAEKILLIHYNLSMPLPTFLPDETRVSSQVLARIEEMW